MTDLLELSACEAVEAGRDGEVSVGALVDVYLDRIARLDRTLHAYLDVLADDARSRARMLDALGSGERRRLPLFGVPVAIKDNLALNRGTTTAASRILAGFRATYTATAVERLEAAGAVVLGKTNLDEFAMGSSTEHSGYGPTRNPWDLERAPGGSSGGSAAAVAGGLALAALGSDTGGSIRQPAAYCGVVGLLPTYGRVSRYGLLAFASSLDQIGPLTRTVDDAALLFSVIAGPDPHDLTALAEPVPDEIWGRGVEGLRVGVLAEYPDGVDQAVSSAVEQMAAILKDAGARLTPVTLPDPERALAAYYVIAPAEASSNLSRYDGIRYGQRKRAQGLYDLYDETRAAGFGDEVKRRIMLGTFALSAGYYDAYYGRATAVRREIAAAYGQLFEGVDVILCPTAPDQPFRLGERLSDPWRMYVSDLFTVSVNLAGLPALSLPAGLSGALPTAVQVVGPRLGEERVFQVARTLEARTAPMPPAELQGGASR